MARIQIPLDALTSRLNLGERFSGFGSGPLSGRFSNLRPISEFLDFKRLSKPANFSDAQSRINYNLSHFSSNYAVVFAMLSLYALLTNWLLLFDIILVVVGMWFIGRLDGRDLEIGTFRATSSQLYTGLLIVAIPLGLIASPFSTLLWLIGASGVTILGGLGGRPRAPKFAPQWGRPSRRGRRKTDGDAAHYSSWDNDPRVEELGTEGEDTDTQGVGLAVRRRNTRFVSDSLNFTGIDLGDRTSGTYRRQEFSDSEKDGDSTSIEGDSEEDDDDEFSDYLSSLSPEEREEVLLRSALQLISRAQANGDTNVHLNKQELEAYGRYLKRMEEEERARQKKKRNSGSGNDKKKRAKEQRMAVPLTQLAPTSRKKKSSPSSSAELPPRQDSLPRQRASNDLPPDGRDRQGYPPMGYFPPPSASRTRPRAGTTTSQRPSGRAHNEYEYASRPSSASRPRSSRGSPRDEASTISSRSHIDPFQFQTAGPRAPFPAGAAVASRRHVSGPEIMYEQRRGTVTPAAARSRHGSRRASYEEYTSDEGNATSEESTSDDRANGAQIREPARQSRGRGRNAVLVVEESPERTKSKKKSSSPVKRKQVGGKKKKK
ncbi:hypothetical protein QQS21_005542 [Conoideocrella luteorostrata]|uniref:PRA1 family protein n=1 Tax=Conoideocrella luteorostrata TaxID=1105319 RepID=A0AAJ0CTK3_9HYPO|nr:hypothetical protein QQS21_005542 [Conoideocrella luteorostrata]